ncbi:hypothetical protein OEZ85_013723 [Tetradesmus obliquus]|uniref:Peptidase C1A papain C-terminal domain-containing protein n=1 Tax=Tetradesmus obliquus TaxID=3088 RepID=A0ABY8UTX6_TETOB|nr:hypothetical protein OEZ85_013723 [Tetradesmus obliquus]
MLNGGVITSIAMSQAVFKLFSVYNKTAVFDTTEDLSPSRSAGAPEVAPYTHALFCYGWRDTPNGDGHWLCKNSWSSRWGNNGTIRIAYASTPVPIALTITVAIAKYCVVWFAGCSSGWRTNPGALRLQVLRLVCSCLRESPASDTWDLSSLLVNGSANAPHLLGKLNEHGGGSGDVFSQRVLSCMSGADSGCAALLVRGWLQQPVGLPRYSAAGPCKSGMFTDVVCSAPMQGEERDCICFQGTLAQDVFSFQKGTRVHVSLSGAGESMRVVGGGRSYENVLRFGCGFVLGPRGMCGSS